MRTRERMDEAVRRLTPGSFAFVMATGIVSIAALHEGWGGVSRALAGLSVLGFVVLVALNLVRLVRHRAALVADLRSPARAFGAFTLVAAVAVLGTRAALAGQQRIAVAVLVVAVITWVVLGYAVPAVAWAGSRAAAGGFVRHADGSWFVWVVASQSVAVLAATVLASTGPSLTGPPLTGSARDAIALLAVCCWAIGIFLYAAVVVTVAVRLTTFRLEPTELTAPYWVGMGATAITVVAGSTILGLTRLPLIMIVHDFVAGVTLVFWAFGTWLIVPLLVAGYWRHVRHRVPLRYELGLWSIVFPLGMYGVASHDLGQREGLDLLSGIGHIEGFVALAAWLATMLAMITVPLLPHGRRQPPGR